jgi:CHASE3 domain sensor protein
MDGRISIQEFVEAYFSQTVQVEDRIEELGKLITEDSKKREEIIKKLQEIQASE